MYLVLYLFFFFYSRSMIIFVDDCNMIIGEIWYPIFYPISPTRWWKQWSYAIIEWTSLDRSAQYKSKNHIEITSETMICLLASKIKKKGVCEIEDEQQNYSNWSNSLFIGETHVNGGYIVSIERERWNYIALTMKLNISCPFFAIGSTHPSLPLSLSYISLHTQGNFLISWCAKE